MRAPHQQSGPHGAVSSTDEYPGAWVYRQVVRAKLYLDAHYAESVDLRSLAGEAFYSRHHFHRLFRRMYGMTPHQYRRRLRIERAKAMLSDGCAVTEACLATGFESLSTFSATFKAIVGVAPSRYAATVGRGGVLAGNHPLRRVPGCFLSRLAAADKGH